MNKYYRISLAIIFLSGIMVSLFSCKESNEWDDVTYRNAEYPEQLIYMPVAYYNNGQYVIDDISRIRGELPIEGSPYKYIIDLEKRQFRVPLAVYRAGINNKGAFTVNIRVNTDTIAIINENRADKYLVIPSDKFSLVSSVKMKDGEEIAKFDLIVDLDFLRNNYPDKIYAIGVEISSTQRDRNPELSTAIVVIHTKIIKPTADFTFSFDSADNNKVFFNNTSLMSEKYQWDFGDGSPASVDFSPSHVYSTKGTYTVSLTALGITGDEDKSVKTKVITIE